VEVKILRRENKEILEQRKEEQDNLKKKVNSFTI
jgi:hypothetical protein